MEAANAVDGVLLCITWAFVEAGSRRKFVPSAGRARQDDKLRRRSQTEKATALKTATASAQFISLELVQGLAEALRHRRECA